MESERKRDPDGRFNGVRVDVESVPRLPTFPARWALEHRQPFLVVWTEQSPNSYSSTVTMAPSGDQAAVQVTFESGKTQHITILGRPLPRGTGIAIFYICPGCRKPRRYLYRLKLSGDHLVDDGCLRCQACAGLRFASQGWYKPAWAAAWGPRARNTWDPEAVAGPRISSRG